MSFQKIFLIFITVLMASSAVGKELVVGVIDIPPFGFSSNKDMGIHVEFMTSLLKKANLPFRIVVMPYPRVVNSLQSGKVDLALLYKRARFKNTKEVAKSLGFKNFVVSKRERPLLKREQLNGKKIAIVRSAKYEDKFDQSHDIKKISVNDYLQALIMLANGRVDGAVISEPALNYYQALRPDLFASIEKYILLSTKRNYIYARADLEPKTVQKIELANRELIKDTTLRWIFRPAKKTSK